MSFERATTKRTRKPRRVKMPDGRTIETSKDPKLIAREIKQAALERKVRNGG